jgi:hypothetical protein
MKDIVPWTEAVGTLVTSRVGALVGEAGVAQPARKASKIKSGNNFFNFLYLNFSK